MDEISDEPTTLENLVHAHRGDLKAKRSEAEDTTNSAPDTQTNEEKLWDKVQQELLHDRLNKAPKAPNKDGFENFLEHYSLLVALAVPILALIITLPAFLSWDAVQSLKNLAFAATLIGLMAAFCRVLAHRGSVALDGLGKMLGLSSALLATAAAGILLWLVKLGAVM